MSVRITQPYKMTDFSAEKKICVSYLKTGGIEGRQICISKNGVLCFMVACLSKSDPGSEKNPPQHHKSL